jgi:hypothetical protein
MGDEGGDGSAVEDVRSPGADSERGRKGGITVVGKERIGHRGLVGGGRHVRVTDGGPARHVFDVVRWVLGFAASRDEGVEAVPGDGRGGRDRGYHRNPDVYRTAHVDSSSDSGGSVAVSATQSLVIRMRLRR